MKGEVDMRKMSIIFFELRAEFMINKRVNCFRMILDNLMLNLKNCLSNYKFDVEFEELSF